MTTQSMGLLVLYFCMICAAAWPMGLYMTRVFQGDRTLLSPLLRPMERTIYRLMGCDESENMKWAHYAGCLLAFTMAGVGATYLLLRLQGSLPFNPQGFGTKEMTPDLAFNTAISFATNTNWQSYVPESTLSYFSNMVSLAIHNWMSAATGMAVAVALVRGIASRDAGGIGSFWVDITRSTLYILLPLCAVFTLILVQQGVPQTFDAPLKVSTMEGSVQTIALGPVATQESIKMLGTNGGGFFNANSAHPFENPTPLTNFLQMVSIFLIPAGLTILFGKMVGNVRQGWALFGAMSLLFLVGSVVCLRAEQQGNPNVTRLHIASQPSTQQPGGNMEGKEMRFGIASSALFAAVTTAASCGAVNSMHDSYTPLGGLVTLVNILTGEVIFGGVGSGLYGMLLFAILAVFIAGLMVGRTPEYLGKKIERFEVKMAMLVVLVMAASILVFSAIGANLELSEKSALNRVGESETYYGATYNNVNNSGPHGFSEILYAYTSATGNNGSAFAGLTANTPIYNTTLAIAMFVGRFFMIIPILSIAGSLAQKKPVPTNMGTFPTDSVTFVLLLAGVVVIVGALTFIPALALGPIVEHLQMLAGKLG